MFKSFATFAAFIVLAFAATTSQAQTVAQKDASGNYQQVVIKPTVESLTATSTKTAATFTDKDGQKFPVYTSASGKAFIVKTSKKTGNPYKVYFKVQ